MIVELNFIHMKSILLFDYDHIISGKKYPLLFDWVILQREYLSRIERGTFPMSSSILVSASCIISIIPVFENPHRICSGWLFFSSIIHAYSQFNIWPISCSSLTPATLRAIKSSVLSQTSQKLRNQFSAFLHQKKKLPKQTRWLDKLTRSIWL